MVDATTAATVGIVFLGTMVRASLGFGEALVAVPLLALVMPVEQAAPLAVLVSITVAGLILLRDWRQVQFGGAGRLLGSTLFGIPVGLWLLRTMPESVVKGLLAVLLMGFSLHVLRGRLTHTLPDDRWAWVFGLQAGVLGGAYGMNGPPLVVYGSLRGWRPEEFRATLQAYFLPAGVAGMGGYWVAGLWTEAVTQHYVASLPGVLVAVVVGRAIHARVPAGRFPVYVHLGLMGIGAALLWQAVGG